MFPRDFPRLQRADLQKLCDGLAASTLIAWSRVIGDALDRMRSAANRRVEAELCAVRLCSLDADSYDTLGGRVEALEEKLKNGVPVQAAQPMPASGTAAGIGDEPPPPDDSDARIGPAGRRISARREKTRRRLRQQLTGRTGPRCSKR